MSETPDNVAIRELERELAAQSFEALRVAIYLLRLHQIEFQNSKLGVWWTKRQRLKLWRDLQQFTESAKHLQRRVQQIEALGGQPLMGLQTELRRVEDARQAIREKLAMLDESSPGTTVIDDV